MKKLSKRTTERCKIIRDYIFEIFAYRNIKDMTTFRKLCYRYFDKIGSIPPEDYYNKYPKHEIILRAKKSIY